MLREKVASFLALKTTEQETAIAFGGWLHAFATQSADYWLYEGELFTTDQLYEIWERSKGSNYVNNDEDCGKL